MKEESGEGVGRAKGLVAGGWIGLVARREHEAGTFIIIEAWETRLCDAPKWQ